MTLKDSPESSAALTHLNDKGEMHMVDVGEKPSTHRVARAQARVRLGEASRQAIANGSKKGDVLAAARFAGITGAKQTSNLIPLCHPLGLSHVSVDITLTSWGLLIEAQAETHGPTGVEMEAMTAASVAALTIYDMLKAVERGIIIESTALVEKRGGRSGHWTRSDEL